MTYNGVTVELVYQKPENLFPLQTEYSVVIQNCYAVRFYIRGGADVVAIKKVNPIRMIVYNPAFSSLAGAAAEQAVKTHLEVVQAEMVKQNIPIGEWFLFDTRSKTILRPSDFSDTAPYYSVRQSIFCIQNADKSWDYSMRYLADASDFSAMQFLLLILAKRELIAPTMSSEWGLPGKKLLSFLICKRYGVKTPFKWDTGPWDRIRVETDDNRLPLTLRMSEMSLRRSTEIADEVIAELKSNLTTPFDEMFKPPSEVLDPNMKTIMLTSLLEIGLETIFKGDFSKVISVEIDVSRDVYKSITIDTVSNLCFVELNKGVNVSAEQLKEDFNSEYVQLAYS